MHTSRYIWQERDFILVLISNSMSPSSEIVKNWKISENIGKYREVSDIFIRKYRIIFTPINADTSRCTCQGGTYKESLIGCTTIYLTAKCQNGALVVVFKPAVEGSRRLAGAHCGSLRVVVAYWGVI